MALTQQLKERPWRFAIGDTAYVAGWPTGQTVKILAAVGMGRFDFPHYYAMDDDGNEWQFPQVRLSKNPIQQ
jgi:hypothetical protein